MPMRVAININGQFKNMTGIQHTVDSLITALYESGTRHEIVAFAPALESPAQLGAAARDGLFAWRGHPRARIDTAGNGRRLLCDFLEKDHPWLHSQVRPWELRLHSPLSADERANRASRRYALLHTPEPGDYERYGYDARRHVATFWDLATRFCPWAYDEGTIAVWERYFDFAKQRCARLVAISEATKAGAVEHLGIPEDRIDVTPLAARATTRRMEDGPERREVLSAWDLADRPFVLYAGTLERRKNLDTLIDAFASAVHEARLSDPVLVLAGGIWNHLDVELRARADERGVGERLVVTNYVTNRQLNALMSACDVFAFVSRYEGFGMPPLEAMVCGAPVVTSNASSLPEVVGDAGVTAAPDDTEAVAAGLHRMLTDREENARRRAMSAARAAQFTWARTAERTLKAYEAALA